MPFLVSKDSKLLWIAATLVPSKGTESAYAVKSLANLVRALGHKRAIMKSDQEPSIKASRDAAIRVLGKEFEILSEESPVGVSQGYN